MRPTRNLLPFTILCCVSFSCGDDVAVTPDGGFDAGLPIELRCPIDNADRPDRAVRLNVGERLQGSTQICPPGDMDWFVIDIPAGQPLLTVEVGFDQGVRSAVDLAYDIFTAANTETPLASGVDTNPSDNRSTVIGTHYVSESGGTHYIRVRDVGGDEQDVDNAYYLRATTSADPDLNEPNNDCAAAKPLNGTTTGVIGSDGDVDAFLINVPAGSQIVAVNLTTAQASEVDFQLSLYAPGGVDLVTREVDPIGGDGPTNLELRRGLLSPGGNYCLVVQDDDGPELDPTGIYTLSVVVSPETDPNELATRNDTPATATVIPAGGGTVSGLIATKADLDWYEISTPVGRIIEVEFNCPDCWTTMQPSVVYVYPHSTSPCDSASTCDYLLVDSGSCTRDNDCGSGVCRDIPGGQKRCARSCEGDLDCASFQCQLTGNVAACAGVGSCMTEGQCGVQQLFIPQQIELQSGSYRRGDPLRTAQPAQAAKTYLLVHDFNDQRDSAATYSFTVRSYADPDSGERDNFYMPLKEDVLLDEARYRNSNSRRQTGWTSMGGRAVASGTGCIGYESDIDRWVIGGGNPCTVASGTVASDFCGLQIAVSPRPVAPNAWGADLVFFVGGNSIGGGVQQSVLGADLTFGDNACGSGREECFLARGGGGEITVTVRDASQSNWSSNAIHCYNWTITSATDFGCPASCPSRYNNEPTGNCICN